MKLPVRPNIANLIPYPPGKPLEELEREYGITGSIKLASNENAMGPSPKAVAAVTDSLKKLHRYPDGSCYYLAQALAKKIGVAPNQLVFGNGSNEIIQLLIAAFLASGEEVITSQPTFLVYQKAVQAQGGVNRVVPLVGMHHDLAAIARQITDKTRLIFLDNPNNPCGTVFSNEAFAAFLEKVPDQVIVALDEAYVDFVEPGLRLDARDYLKHRVPVVALRTFSKAYGLAGLRVGYGLMHADIADYLHRVRQPFNVSLPAQAGALAALADDEHYEKTMAFTREGIAWLSHEVERLGCRAFPTQTNFFLIDVQTDGKKLYEALLHQGVIVRPMNAYGYPTYIRITVGLPAENQRFIKALATVLGEIDRA
ncbi:MAG TPA: histidinol-phosphate transaminase [Desulfobulbaceae bacterium]|nr:MAG: histidinol-phosphate transaminase [Deltaproteobacteria bacterium RIFOXYD12_FULL_53_23]HCC55111.1 histidinol-phosphate transaminase [Desulfobulbaceae bacterium]